MRPLEFWDMAPADFNALSEGYENKKRSEQELMRQQTFIMVSPYMDKGTGYERFKRRWQFGWETSNVPELKPLTPEECKQILMNHQRIADNRKKK